MTRSILTHPAFKELSEACAGMRVVVESVDLKKRHAVIAGQDAKFVRQRLRDLKWRTWL